MDRRRFLRTAGLGIATVPLGRFLAACGDASAVTSATNTSMAATTSIAATTTTTGVAAAEAAPVTQAEIVGAICRDAWGATAVGTNVVPHTIDRLTVHHTASLLDRNSKAPSRLRGHQAYHKSLGWPDLAYHVAVDADGNIYAARPTTARGDTATNYDPTGHFLVVAEGDFNSQPIPTAQLEGVAAVLAWAATEFSADPSTIRGHRDLSSTSCPGDDFYAFIADGTLETMVEGHIADGGIDLRVVCDDTAFAAVAAIEAGEVPPHLATQASFYLRNSNSQGNADTVIEDFGDSDWIPVAGNFGE